MENKFTTKFKPFVCAGDSITAEIDGFEIIARIEYDNDAGAPDNHDAGFWPNITDKDSAGYMGMVSQKEWKAAHDKAQAVMNAWKKDEWFYVGVILTVRKNGVTLDEHAASLWGVECNYPGSDNSYLTETANELLDDALEKGREVLAKLCAANASLIAAAPELLEALEAAAKHMRDPHPAGDDLSYILDAADAVIAKTRGQK